MELTCLHLEPCFSCCVLRWNPWHQQLTNIRYIIQWTENTCMKLWWRIQTLNFSFFFSFRNIQWKMFNIEILFEKTLVAFYFWSLIVMVSNQAFHSFMITSNPTTFLVCFLTQIIHLVTMTIRTRMYGSATVYPKQQINQFQNTQYYESDIWKEKSWLK